MTCSYVCRHSKVKNTFCDSCRGYMKESVWRKGVIHDPETISPRSSEDSEGVKWLLQQETGCLFSKTASHNTVSDSIASLTFFFPLSSFTHYQFYFSLDPPNPPVFMQKARLVTSVFLHAEFPLYWESGEYRQHWYNYMISEIFAFFFLPWFEWIMIPHRWVQSAQDIKRCLFLEILHSLINQNVFNSCHLYRRWWCYCVWSAKEICSYVLCRGI